MRTVQRSLNGDNADALRVHASTRSGVFLDTDFFSLL
jgi:hypothetical protein